MTEIADQVSNRVDNDYMMNQTLRNYKSLNPESILSGGGDFDKAIEGLAGGDLPLYMDADLPPIDRMNSVSLAPPKQPQWGCMKGGSLPTYSIWKNQTQRAREPVPPPAQPAPINLGNMSMSSIGSVVGGRTDISQSPKSLPLSIRTTPEPPPSILNGPRLSQLKQTMEKVKASEAAMDKNKLKYGKRKKTIRRTYKLGKSRITPKVSVLISNKTIRKNISTKTEKLRQVPIDEIRAVLIKKGFIKVGSLATNDVLRKMYESMLLVCGEVENHNPDNMLYNYFHS
jgi:hypothetical protein